MGVKIILPAGLVTGFPGINKNKIHIQQNSGFIHFLYKLYSKKN
jgi:hypothetical protein